jgi:hypothetical protein
MMTLRDATQSLAAAEDLLSHAMRLQEVTAALSEAQTEDDVAQVVLDGGLGVVESIRGGGATQSSCTARRSRGSQAPAIRRSPGC